MQFKELMRHFELLSDANAERVARERDLHTCLQNCTPLELHNNAQDKLNISYKELETRLTAVQKKQEELSEGERVYMKSSHSDLMPSQSELSTSLRRNSEEVAAKLAAFSQSLNNGLEEQFSFLN